MCLALFQVLYINYLTSQYLWISSIIHILQVRKRRRHSGLVTSFLGFTHASLIAIVLESS